MRETKVCERCCCNPSLLSRFFDQEIGPEEDVAMEEHVTHCTCCQRVVRENEALSRVFTASLEGQLADADLERLEARVIERIQKKKAPWGMRLRDLLVSSRFYVPVAAAATALMLFVLFMGRPDSGAAPSAIVSSFEGNVASVMILETPESHQTILWISESILSNGGDNENHQT